MKEPKHVRNQIEQRLVNRHVRFNREGVRPYEVENWDVCDQEEIERNESNEDDEEETEVNKNVLRNFAIRRYFTRKMSADPPVSCTTFDRSPLLSID